MSQDVLYDSVRRQMARAIAEELQPQLPGVQVLAQYGYIYVIPPQRQITAIFWPDGVSVDLGRVLHSPYFYYWDREFPDNLIRHLIHCVAALADQPPT